MLMQTASPGLRRRWAAGGNSPQQPAQNIGAGDNSLLLAPEEDGVLVYHVVLGVDRIPLQPLQEISYRQVGFRHQNGAVAKIPRLTGTASEKGCP